MVDVRTQPRSSDDAADREHVEAELAAERAALDSAANGGKLTQEKERGALEFLLGARQPLLYTVRVTYETADGQKDLRFVIKQLDGRRIDALENRHRDRTTGAIDQIKADLDVVSEAAVAIEDETGRSIEPMSEEFRKVSAEQPPMASPSDAIAARFREQLGLISGVAREVRRVSGWSVERVGEAERRLVDAARG